MTAGTGRLAGRHVALIGAGYAAREFARQAMAAGARISATARDVAKANDLRAAGISVLAMDGQGLRPDALAGVTDLLISTPPGQAGCPGLALTSPALPFATHLVWIGYLSSTAVYGDCGGEWIDETCPTAPRTADASGRLLAEEDWGIAATAKYAAYDILRIAGIYGPRRNLLGMLRSGQAKAIDKPGQVFNRIHRDDIAGAVLAAMLSPAGKRLTNLADGHPCSSVELMQGVAALLGMAPPPVVPFDASALPPGMAGFYAENRRLQNDRLRALLGGDLRYRDWRAGYAAILATEPATAPSALGNASG